MGMIAVPRLIAGLDLLIATLLVAMLALSFLIVTRVNAETGLLFVQPGWQAVGVLVGLFGLQAMDPTTIIALGILGVVLAADPRVCLMPLVANGLKLAETQRLKLPAVGGWMFVALVLGLALALPFTLYAQYDVGGIYCAQQGHAGPLFRAHP
jgi:hypothetical protein